MKCKVAINELVCRMFGSGKKSNPAAAAEVSCIAALSPDESSASDHLFIPSLICLVKRKAILNPITNLFSSHDVLHSGASFVLAQFVFGIWCSAAAGLFESTSLWFSMPI